LPQDLRRTLLLLALIHMKLAGKDFSGKQNQFLLRLPWISTRFCPGLNELPLMLYKALRANAKFQKNMR
jgi:hypothetical protein